MISNPKVSIIIPVYNGEKYMRDAIDSALNQIYSNIEIIVVNDGSVDNTDEIAKSYGNKIKYFKKENGGVSSALNLGINKMSGDYFSWLSHDDLYKPNKIAKEILALSNLGNKETIIGCNVDIVNKSLKLIKKNIIPESAKKSIKCFLAFDYSIGLNGCSLLIPKKLFDKYGLFNENLKITQDYEMWLRFAENEAFFFINDNLVLSRMHKNQVGNTSSLVISEVDFLHSNIIKQITYDDLLLFTNNNFDECIDYYNYYLNIGYKQSALETLFLYINCLLKNNQNEKALNYINKNVFKNNFHTNINLFSNFGSNNKLTLVFHNSVWVKGGVERVLCNLFKVFPVKYNIVFVTSEKNASTGYDIPDNIKVIKISPNLKQNIDIILAFICKLENANIFVGNSNLDELFLPTYKLLYLLGIKTIAYNHYNYFLPCEENWLSTLEKIRIPYYKYVNLVTWSTLSSYTSYSKVNNNGYYLPNPNTFNQIYKEKSFSNNILCVGRFTEPKKRLDLSLMCFKKVLEKLPDSHLTVIGPYDLNMKINNSTLKQLLTKLNFLDSQITFIGECDNLIPYYENADILMLTSETEGFGMVLTEAATFGVPSIAFDIDGIDDIIKDNESGYLIPKYNIDEMAKTLVNYLINIEIKKTFSKKSLELSCRFNMDKIFNDWEKIIFSLSSNNNSCIFINKNESQIIQDYEAKLINKGNYINQLFYYLKTFGVKKTIKKILNKLF